MDIFFQDPNDIPLPPEEVRIRELRAEPFPDQRRVRIFLEITPFQQKPNCEIKVLTEDGAVAASLSIIESIDPKMDFTVHLKGEHAAGKYSVSLEIYYYEDEQTKEESSLEPEADIHHLPSSIQIVDHRQTTFTIGKPPISA